MVETITLKREDILKKIIIGMLALTSLQAFAFETTCKLQNQVYSGVDATLNKNNKTLKIRYLGNSKLELSQTLIKGFSGDLHLIALSQSIETRVGSKVKAYGELESFAASFSKRDSASGLELRIKIHEDKTFQLFIENEAGKEIHAYSGKCQTRLSKEDIRLMIEDINEANKSLKF
jgi:hypothetical protein